MKEFSDSAETSFTMLSDEGWTPSHQELPSLIKPTGLPLTRQWYLYNQIREYCRDGTQDITCPKPSVPLSAEPSNNVISSVCTGITKYGSTLYIGMALV